jgi:hypothetical protein
MNGIAINALALILIFVNAYGERRLSFRQLEQKPEKPHWLIPIKGDVNQSIWTEYKIAHHSSDSMKNALCRYAYFIDNHAGSDRLPFWLLKSAQLFENPGGRF